MPKDKLPSILVLTNPSDFHSFVIAEALRRKGASVFLWHGSDFPSRQLMSVEVDGDLRRLEAYGPELEILDQQFSSVWLRRPGWPVMPPVVEPEDRPFALRECRQFLASLYQIAGQNAFWVNPAEVTGRADSKLRQLRIAARAGFKIPRTLMSNDPKKIREFLRANPPCIYKSFYPASWHAPDRVAVAFSSVVEESDLPEDPLLQSTPGIFQRLVNKSYELRITALGCSLIAAKLESQGLATARIDWRAATEPVPMEPVEIPESVAIACRQVMEDLGIVFGCFDLIVTPEGDYVFLEVNERGAFLWIEEQNPQFRLVDAFCQFLMAASHDFRWRGAKNPIAFADVHAAALQAMEAATETHVTPPPVTTQEGA